MRVLAVDTALGACSAAVLENGSLLAHAFEPMERGHAERLAPMVRETMEEARLEFAALDRLAVTIGPGTFTGQRVGYAFMRGMRLALGRPLIGVTTLATMARAAMAKSGADAVAVLHDARRGEVYAYAETAGEVIVPVQLASIDDATQAIVDSTRSLVGPLAFAGTAGAFAAQRCRELGRSVMDTDIQSPDALWVARLALDAAEPQSVPRPLYLRPPDARLPADRPMAVRSATLADLPVLGDLHARCFTAAWDVEFLGRLLAQRGAFCILATMGAYPSGFAIARAVAGEAEILSLGVAPGYRRRGIGAALAREAAGRAAHEGAGKVFLEVSMANDAGRALYAHLGFREVGRRPGYYPDSPASARDALVLGRALPL